MYYAYFGLKDPPFSITPDPGYLYLSPHHREALAHLLYGTEENGGFVLLTGEVGTGKTTLIRTLLEQPLERLDVALCLNPRLTALELIATICDELRIPYSKSKASLKTLVDALNRHLLNVHSKGRHTVLIIDEAQNLSRDVLEQVRLLTNLETHRHKLLRVMLVGQPELHNLLLQPDLRQLAQRITARYHLPPLNHRQTSAYIQHRLRIAGTHQRLFSQLAQYIIYRQSGGIPRLINIICDRALLGAYAAEGKRVGAATAWRAAWEVLRGKNRRQARPSAMVATMMIVLAIIVSTVFIPHDTNDLPTTELEPAASIVVPSPTATSETIADLSESSAIHDSVTSPPTNTSQATESVQADSDSPPTVAANSQMLSVPVASTNALQQLVRLWNDDLVVDSDQDLCSQIEAHQLRCLSGQGNWTDLRRFNRPVLLYLLIPNGNGQDVLLRGLSEDGALLDLGENKPRLISLAELAPLWSGKFTLIWRPPVDAKLLRPGEQGESVAWLRRQLALATKQSVPDPLSDVYDAALEEQVRRFQHEHDLIVDGLVGAHTMLLLNNLAPTPGTPLLASVIDQV